MSQVDSTIITTYQKCDTISLHQLTKLVKSALKKMRKGVVYSKPEEIIPLVKIYSSKPVNVRSKNKAYLEFLELYNKRYMAMACEILTCTPVIGFVAYSRKYDLYLSYSRRDTMRCYNYYHIRQ
jgi:hypothetical protein